MSKKKQKLLEFKGPFEPGMVLFAWNKDVYTVIDVNQDSVTLLSKERLIQWAIKERLIITGQDKSSSRLSVFLWHQGLEYVLA